MFQAIEAANVVNITATRSTNTNRLSRCPSSPLQLTPFSLSLFPSLPPPSVFVDDHLCIDSTDTYLSTIIAAIVSNSAAPQSAAIGPPRFSPILACRTIAASHGLSPASLPLFETTTTTNNTNTHPLQPSALGDSTPNHQFLDNRCPSSNSPIYSRVIHHDVGFNHPLLHHLQIPFL